MSQGTEMELRDLINDYLEKNPVREWAVLVIDPRTNSVSVGDTFKSLTNAEE